MKFLKGIAALLVLLVLGMVTMAFLFERVPAAAYGVRINRWKGGIEERDFTMGLRWGVAGVHRWELLPRQTHFVHFTSIDKSSKRGRALWSSDIEGSIQDHDEPLVIRTKDNNLVTIDVSVLYSIKEGEAHKIVEEGLLATYRDRVKSNLMEVLRTEIAQLSSEQLQDTDQRLQRADELLGRLEATLGKYHVGPEIVLIRRVEFPEGYERQLHEKQLLVQQMKLDMAETLRNREQLIVDQYSKRTHAERLLVERGWDRDFQVERSNTQVAIQEIESEADVYEAQTRADGAAKQVIAEAEGRLEIERALALRDQLRNEALNTRGGHILLALDAVENLRIPNVTLNSDDPAVPMLLDLGAMTRMLVGEEEKAP